MESDFFELVIKEKEKQEMDIIEKCNERTSKYGLSLSAKEAKQLILQRNKSLRKYKRVEFGNGILDQVIDTFCDSQYIDQNNYLEIMIRLQDIFYEYKNETMDLVSDDELLTFMKEQFESVCFGDLAYLEETCLERFGKEVRAGYTGYQGTGGHGEYDKIAEETRWDKGLYYEALKNLF